MLGDNNGNAALPVFLNENRFRYPANASTNQLQLFGNCKFISLAQKINKYILAELYFVCQFSAALS